MKPIKQFQMGSTYFFSKYKDFKSKDYDELCIMDVFPFNNNMMNAIPLTIILTYILLTPVYGNAMNSLRCKIIKKIQGRKSLCTKDL